MELVVQPVYPTHFQYIIERRSNNVYNAFNTTLKCIIIRIMQSLNYSVMKLHLQFNPLPKINPFAASEFYTFNTKQTYALSK